MGNFTQKWFDQKWVKMLLGFGLGKEEAFFVEAAVFDDCLGECLGNGLLKFRLL